MRRALAALAVLALAVAGCSSSDDDEGGQEAESTGSSESAPAPESTEGSGSDTTAPGDETAEVVDPYDGHTSEVYDEDASWICRPDLADDECRDLDVTVLNPDGTTTVEEREPAADPPIDCFYVYPTVSADPGGASDLEWTTEDNEAKTVVAQAAQYARSCRVFAPVYRQITLSGLGTATEEERAGAYADVVDAWKTYVSQWNDGRGVILIGHSQGMGHLIKLLQDEIDGVPELQDRLVSAHLFGGAVNAPAGELAGGTFQEIPSCTSADEAGCVITWSSYPAGLPPGDDGIFGRSDGDDPAVCTDPTELLGTEAARPVAPVRAPSLIGAIEGTEDLTTPFVSTPDALTVACEETADHRYLAVAVADPADVRPLGGFVSETLGHSWGLHLVDMTVALDDLVALAERQGAAFSE